MPFLGPAALAPAARIGERDGETGQATAYHADGGAVVAATLKDGRMRSLQAMLRVSTRPGESFSSVRSGRGWTNCAQRQVDDGRYSGRAVRSRLPRGLREHPLGGRARGLLHQQLGVELEHDRPTPVPRAAVKEEASANGTNSRSVSHTTPRVGRRGPDGNAQPHRVAGPRSRTRRRLPGRPDGRGRPRETRTCSYTAPRSPGARSPPAC